jgi:hypothetical protein
MCSHWRSFAIPMGAVKARHLPWRTSERPLPARGQSPMPPWRVYINRAASSDWMGAIWKTTAVAAWGWSNCTVKPLRSPEAIATEAIFSASNREISDSAPWDWCARTRRRGCFMVGVIWLRLDLGYLNFKSKPSRRGERCKHFNAVNVVIWIHIRRNGGVPGPSKGQSARRF